MSQPQKSLIRGYTLIIIIDIGYILVINLVIIDLGSIVIDLKFINFDRLIDFDRHPDHPAPCGPLLSGAEYKARPWQPITPHLACRYLLRNFPPTITISTLSDCSSMITRSASLPAAKSPFRLSRPSKVAGFKVANRIACLRLQPVAA